MRFYITTPIYYVTDVPHLGHAYTTVIADVLARYHRLRGDTVGFLTGTDEHGQKIARQAEAAGIAPRAYADKFADAYRATWKALEISNTDFIRTTDADHEALVQELWKKLEAAGDIYLGEYEGHYCVACEQFYTEKELVDGKSCPIHKRPVELVKEKSYYFRLSKYQQPLLDHIEKHPSFILPRERRNEVVSFLKSGLTDLSASRTTFSWGVPVPGQAADGKHIIYVWIDALANYWTATSRAALQGFWGSDGQIVHMMGKDILRFHAVYWPAMLMSAGLPLPTTIFAHGWWTVDGHKMSKTAGNVVDPLKLAQDLGVDAFRYFVVREVPLGGEGDFDHEAFLQRYNAELANDLGNLLNRTLGMVTKYAITPHSMAVDPFATARTQADYAAALDGFAPSRALDDIWALVRKGNAYIDERAPWKPDAPRAEILGNVLELCRVLSHLLEPFLPERAAAMRAQLGVSEATAWPSWSARSFRTEAAVPLFPRVDDVRKAELLERWRPKKTAEATAEAAHDSRISVDDFAKVDLRVARIISAEPVPKAKKLYKLILDLGKEQRQVVAGIAEAYKPEELVDRRVIFVANLKPAVIRGVESQGMILAAGEAEVLGLSALDRDVPPGTKVR